LSNVDAGAPAPMASNLEMSDALGLDIPTAIPGFADEVIE
jgi:hypothetical protein